MDKQDSEADLKAIGAHWDKVTREKRTKPRRDRWVYSQLIHSLLNERILGRRIKGPNQGLNLALKARLDGRVLGHGVSVGGGTGLKEVRLVKQGIVDTMTIYELSDYRIEEGRRIAQRAGLGSRIHFIKANPIEAPSDHQFDLVHWQASLHHMFDVTEAVKWSRDVLGPQGVFYMNEYVGPNRMQYSDEVLELASAIRRMIPERYFSGPDKKRVRRRCVRPDLERITANDPSECVDSERILPAVKEYFPDIELWLLGGIGYGMALTNLIANFDEQIEEDRAWLTAVMEVDGMLSSLGYNLRAAGLAFT